MDPNTGMTWQNWLWLVGSVLSFISAIGLWANSERVVKTRYWPLAWLGYILLISLAFICYFRAGLPT